MSSPKRLLALAALPAVLLTGCGNDDSKASKSSSGSSAASASSASGSSKPSSSSSAGLAAPVTKSKIDDVKVDAANAAKPSVTIAKVPFGTAKTETKISEEGSGAVVGSSDWVDADFVVVNGTTGKTATSSFGQDVPTFDLSNQANLPGLMSALKGKKAGTSMVVSIPSAEAFGKAGRPELGIGAHDNLVMYVTINSTTKPCSASATDPSMPKVSVTAGKPATITFPKTPAPKTLTCAVLKQGTGATVAAGQTISTEYTGQIWNGKVFDSSAKTGKPADFQIGVNQVISAWDKALVGRKVGDRVLIVVPPVEGYQQQGNAQAGIKGTDTLVFVAEIKAAK